jgi:hypothetical protein
MTASALARRLITLIFAGRNRRDMIRRELPRTSSAGWVRRPFRIILVEGSPFRGPSAVISSAVRQSFTSLCCLGQLELCFGMHRDRPHESEQFARKRRYGLIMVLAARGHRRVAFMQSLLGLPGDLLGFIAER